MLASVGCPRAILFQNYIAMSVFCRIKAKDEQVAEAGKLLAETAAKELKGEDG
jgi:hypothetical protein